MASRIAATAGPTIVKREIAGGQHTDPTPGRRELSGVVCIVFRKPCSLGRPLVIRDYDLGAALASLDLGDLSGSVAEAAQSVVDALLAIDEICLEAARLLAPEPRQPTLTGELGPSRAEEPENGGWRTRLSTLGSLGQDARRDALETLLAESCQLLASRCRTAQLAAIAAFRILATAARRDGSPAASSVLANLREMARVVALERAPTAPDTEGRGLAVSGRATTRRTSSFFGPAWPRFEW